MPDLMRGRKAPWPETSPDRSEIGWLIPEATVGLDAIC